LNKNAFFEQQLVTLHNPQGLGPHCKH